MGTGKTNRWWAAAFFCGLGAVYNGPANADGGVIEPDPSEAEFTDADQAAEAEMNEPISLFEQDDTALPQGQSVNVGSFGEIDLHVKDLDLTKVLQLLSIQSQRNIIASRNVAGKVSADLYGVDFYEAMDAILSTNGFGYEEKGNFIYVYTAEELEQKRLAERELATKVIRLNYLTATDAGAFLQPMLSASGSLSLSGETGEGFEPSLSNAGGDSQAFESTVVINDYPEIVEKMVGLIEELDTRPKQVLIESMILTASLQENNEFGVDFAIFTDVNINDFVTPLGAVDQLIAGGTSTLNAGQVVTSSVGNTAAPGGFKVGIFNDDFALFVRALDQVTDTTVMAKPQLLVLNRQKADLLVGERLGYLSSTSTDTSTTQTVEFLDIGTRLTVRPFISTDDFIRLEVRPSVSDGSTTVQAGQIIPNETTNEMISNVMVKSGQTVVLGGFFKESNDIDRRQIPGGGDIPVVGYLFKGQEDEMKRDEVIFMLRPTVMKDEQLALQAESAAHGAELAVLGSRDRLLPWSHQRLVSSALTSAREHMANGEIDDAMWDADVALYLDPASVEAMRIKEELTGERYYYAEDSILTSSIEDMIDTQTEALINQEGPVTDAEAPIDAAEPAPTQAEAEAGEAVASDADPIAEAEATTEPESAQGADAEWAEADAGAEAADTDADAVVIVEAGAFDAEPTDAQPVADAQVESSDADADAPATETAEVEPAADEQPYAWWEDTPADADADALADQEAMADADAEIDAFLEAEEQAATDDDQPMSIFDFVNREVSGLGDDASADADADATFDEAPADDDTEPMFEVVEVDPATIEDIE